MHELNRDADTIGKVRKGSFYSFIAFLSISALLAIASVLSGSFGEFELKVLMTTLAIAVASICSLCCSAFSSRAQNPWPGVAGIILAGGSAAMMILGLWTEMDAEGYWKTALVCTVFTLASAHALALLAIPLRPAHAWLKMGTAINIFALAALVSAMILGEITDQGIFKVVAVLAILAALETLVVPILGRLARVAPRPRRETLSLTKNEDGTYEAPDGRVFHLHETSDASTAGSGMNGNADRED